MRPFSICKIFHLLVYKALLCFVIKCTLPSLFVLIAPNVTLTSPSGPFYEGTSQTLTCTATLQLPVNSDVAVSIHWTPATNSDRVTISSLSSQRSPFISTLTLNPLVMSDTGLYSCEATVYLSSQNATDNITQPSQQLNLVITGTYSLLLHSLCL